MVQSATEEKNVLSGRAAHYRRDIQRAGRHLRGGTGMNVITEEVNYSTIEEKDSGPSCSLAEALERQDLYINSILAQVGCDILWRMFKEGRTLYRGAYINLNTLRVNPIPV